MKHLPYRRAVGIVLLNREGHVLIGRRKEDKDSGEHGLGDKAWQMPQGGIDGDEEPYKAALRELYEETNVSSVSFLAEAPDWYAYDLPADVIGQTWKGRYRGQTQKWFALRFEGAESEIDIHHPGGGKHRAEFDSWRWERLSSLPRLIVPFKRGVYENVVDNFSHLVPGEA